MKDVGRRIEDLIRRAEEMKASLLPTLSTGERWAMTDRIADLRDEVSVVRLAVERLAA